MIFSASALRFHCVHGDPAADPRRAGNPDDLCVRWTGRRRHPFRIPRRKAEAEGSAFYQQVWPTVQKNYDVGLEILHSMPEERVAASTVEDEPSLPVSRERFLTNPIHAR
jgi:hypothetical protein